MAVAGAEEHFAKKLANNDKKIRDRALKRLQAWIASRPSTGAGFGELELLKIWKGLFYCFWMSDKPLIQEELAENISKLQHSFKNKESGFAFIITFFKTIHKEWHGIDRLRMDKFYLLVRMFVKQNFEFLKANSWDQSICTSLCDIYKVGPLHPTKENVPDGMKLHLCGVFLAELVDVGKEKVSSEIISILLEPFFVLAAETKSQVVSRAVKDGVLEKILEIEESKRLNTEYEPDEEEDAEQKEVQQTLQINCQAIADKLFTLGSDRQVLGRNRKLLYLYAKKLKKAILDNAEEEIVRKRKLEHEKENEELDIPIKKQKKSKSNGAATSEEVREVENEPELKQRSDEKKKKRKKKKNVPLDDDADHDKSANEILIEPNMKKKKTKENPCQIVRNDCNGNTKEIVNHIPVNESTYSEQASTACNGLEEDQTTNDNELSTQDQSMVSEEVVEKTLRDLRHKITSTQQGDKTPKRKKKKQEKESNGTTPFAVFTKAKTPPAFFKNVLPQTEPRKTKNTKLSCPRSAPQGSKKKVRIHLAKNIAQSPSDYVKSVTSSPSIPFDARRSPEFGLLKTKSLTKKRTPTKRSKAVDFF